jgi:hypothetical protein
LSIDLPEAKDAELLVMWGQCQPIRRLAMSVLSRVFATPLEASYVTLPTRSEAQAS